MKAKKIEPLELLSYVSISAGMALAASCYTITGKITAYGNPFVIYGGFALAWIICLLTSMAISELGARFPTAPGVRTYLKNAYGDLTSLAFTYIAIFVVIFVAGIEVYVLMQIVAPGKSLLMQTPIIIALLIVITYINSIGMEAPKKLQTLLFVSLVILSVFLSVCGLPVISESATDSVFRSEQAFSSKDLLAVTGLAVFLFMGFEWVTPMGKNRNSYEKMIPWSMPISISVLFLVYVLFSLGLGYSESMESLKRNSAPHLTLGLHLFPLAGNYIVIVISVLALLTTLNAGLMGASRLLYVVAREGGFTPRLNRVCTKISDEGVTVGAIYLLAAMGGMASFAMLYFDASDVIGSVCAALYCTIYCAFILSHVKLKGVVSKRKIPFESKIPIPIFIFLAGCLPVFGVGALMSSANPWSAAAVFSGIFALSFTLAFLAVNAAKIPFLHGNATE